jgi:2-polyprenyl-3-methyl-5-hydroxy-6-metoxy-1,4-benzoquinol methylase
MNVQTPIDDAQIWDKWNTTYRQGRLDEPSKRRLREVLATMADLKVQGAKILEVGCGTGWMSAALSKFGKVTGVDLGSKIIETAQKSYPEIDFHSGDFHTVDLPLNYFDVIVCLETLAHIADQPACMHRLATLLKPGGFLLLTTQNKSVFERRADVAPPDGWIRQWVTMKTLKRLLRPEFTIRSATTLEPEGHLGFLYIVNSARLNHYLSQAIGAERVKRLKESLGYGQSIYVVAVRR